MYLVTYSYYFITMPNTTQFAHHAKLFWRCRHLQQAGGAASGSSGPTADHVDPVQAGDSSVHGPGLQHGRCRRAGEAHRAEAPHFVRGVVRRLGHVQAHGAAAVSTATACHKHLSEQLVSGVCQEAKDIRQCFSHFLMPLSRLRTAVRLFSLLLYFRSDQCDASLAPLVVNIVNNTTNNCSETKVPFCSVFLCL